MLMWRPCYRFHCSYVVREPSLWNLTIMNTPNQEFVVIASRGQLLLIETPLEPTYFLLMADKLCLKVALSAQISMQDAFVS